MNSYLNIDHVSITFPTDKGPLNVLKDISLKVEEGEFISLIGHSGCGKSTVLNIVAGLLNATEGGVLLEDREVTEGVEQQRGQLVHQHDRRVGGRR